MGVKSEFEEIQITIIHLQEQDVIVESCLLHESECDPYEEYNPRA